MKSQKEKSEQASASETTFLPVRHVQDLRYCFALFACSSPFFVRLKSNIIKVLQKCQWSSTVMSKYAGKKKTTRNISFSGIQQKPKNAMFARTMFVMRRERASERETKTPTWKKDRASDYTRWLTAKKFCLHCECSTFFHIQHNACYICSRMHNIVSLCLVYCTTLQVATATRTHNKIYNCIFIICCVPFWCYCCAAYSFFLSANTEYHKTWWIFDDSVYHVRCWYMGNRKEEEKYQTSCISIWLRQLTITTTARKNIAEKYIDSDDRSLNRITHHHKYFPKKKQQKMGKEETINGIVNGARCWSRRIEYLVHSCQRSCDNYTYKINRIGLKYIIVRMIPNMVADYFQMAFLSVNGNGNKPKCIERFAARQLSNSNRSRPTSNDALTTHFATV